MLYPTLEYPRDIQLVLLRHVRRVGEDQGRDFQRAHLCFITRYEQNLCEELLTRCEEPRQRPIPHDRLIQLLHPHVDLLRPRPVELHEAEDRTRVTVEDVPRRRREPDVSAGVVRAVPDAAAMPRVRPAWHPVAVSERPALLLHDVGLECVWTQLFLRVAHEGLCRFVGRDRSEVPDHISVACGHLQKAMSPEVDRAPLRDDLMAPEYASVFYRGLEEIDHEVAVLRTNRLDLL